MSGDEWMVVIGALALIVTVNWYFFFSGGEAMVATAGTGGRQELTIAVDGGYAPNRVRVARGAPVRLVFDRKETSGCSEEVVFPTLGIRRFLPAHERTAIDLEAPAPGSYEFTCGMGMLRGTLVVE